MKILTILATAAIVAAFGSDAVAQSRYTPPQPAYLSSDLAAPWIVQLRRKPAAGGSYSVEVSRPQPRTAFSGFFSPLQADPVRRNPKPRSVGVLRPAIVEQPAQKPRQAKQDFDPIYLPQKVSYETSQPAGTIIIDTGARFLYLVEGDGTARRYGVGVGREGFQWSGTNKISRKAEWPSWSPPSQMIAREARKGKHLPSYMEGGPQNPLGARAMYLGSTLYRIHGTNQPWSIGQSVSSGCIRMRNEDVIDLYERVNIGAKVVVS